MKIRAIRLENIRRFTDPVEITGIGTGLNVLAAPNEQGKSTIFDALHAVFFKDAKSWDKDIRALAPRAGGEPRVEVEIERDGRSYRLAKQFQKASGKGDVRIWQGDSLFLQSDAAEAWLQSLIKSPKEGGPSGLLWVRQGLTNFADAKETLAARQDLMSSVAGEVDSVTGGQRMDAIRRDVRQSLDRLVTSRGAKKGGALELAMTEAASLAAREQELAAKVQELRGQLDQRQDLRRGLADLQDPETQRALESRLRQTQQELQAAEQYQEKLNTAEQALRNAKLLLENHNGALDAFVALCKDRVEAAQAQGEAAAKLKQIAEVLEPAQSQLKQAEQDLATANAATQAAETRLAQMQRAERLAQAAGQRRALQKALEQARSVMQQVATLKAQAASGPDRATMARVETAREALALASQAQQMGAFALTITYEPGQEGQVTLDGASLAGGARIPLPKGGRLEAPGLGHIDLHPGNDAGSDQFDQAQRGLTAALEAAGSKTVDAARQAHQSRQEAGIRLEEAEGQLQILAPEGVMVLMQRLDDLPEGELEPQGALDDENLEQLEAALFARRADMDKAAAALEQARQSEARHRLDLEGTRVSHQAAQQRLERVEAALAGQGDIGERRAALQHRQEELRQDLAGQKARCLALQQDAPDLATARARAARATSEQAATREAIQAHLRDLAVLDSRIATTAGMAVEEELAEVRDQLVAAQNRLTAVEFEVSVLRRLDLALEQARSAAQEAYIGPVLQELQPLLRLLWPEARLGLDAGQVLPDQLMRAGREESFDSLSGGTQEQIALLVRLAFARLLARGGQPAPIILDDAIVYTDDTRIEKIFDALTLQADEMQILVFTCRQKSFRALGGTQLSIRPIGVPA
ncbi:AAA family ATPase [Pseudophaeobacter sp. EL27]|uniref:AAA family ATPase n=1 Tax=Pseudophaeobacter sp. EL27 TaxID=2107580 RepID=UPI000EFBB62C|nr:AAA family ATPase [Pseudophaeobacter sp. EL27]